MIHEHLVQRFRSLPAPQLSAGFDAQLHRRLSAAHRGGHRPAVSGLIRRWAMPGYWIAAAALGFVTVRPPALTPGHATAIAVAALVFMLTVQRALHRTQLTRILKDALR